MELGGLSVLLCERTGKMGNFPCSLHEPREDLRVFDNIKETTQSPLFLNMFTPDAEFLGF